MYQKRLHLYIAAIRRANYVIENSDGFLKIPMVGFTESLNISVAAAIILQDVTTKLRNSDINRVNQMKKKKFYILIG